MEEEHSGHCEPQAVTFFNEEEKEDGTPTATNGKFCFALKMPVLVLCFSSTEWGLQQL